MKKVGATCLDGFYNLQVLRGNGRMVKSDVGTSGSEPEHEDSGDKQNEDK